MRIFNTGAGDFWRSKIGERLRWLRLTTPQYYQVKAPVAILVEKVARGILPACRRHGNWPDIGIRRGMVSFEWRGRGEIAVSLSGLKVSYTPDPIRRSKTISMVFDASSGLLSVDKYLKGCIWHLFEVQP
jgi:hypothetical protein